MAAGVIQDALKSAILFLVQFDAKPTLVQAQMVPITLRGRDVTGCSQTAIRKMTAFSLPILNWLGRSQVNMKTQLDSDGAPSNIRITARGRKHGKVPT